MGIFNVFNLHDSRIPISFSPYQHHKGNIMTFK